MTRKPLSFPNTNEWLVVCDQHLGRRSDDAQHFIDFLLAVDWSNKGLILLGDVFDVWITRRRYLQPQQIRLIEVLAEIRSGSGAPVIFCAGNREICFRGAGELGASDALVDTETLLDLGGGATAHLSHGDLINTYDLNYRRLRGLLHSNAFYFFVGLIPPKLANLLLGKCERALSKTNLEHKKHFPHEVFKRFLSLIPAVPESRLVALVGHFHPEETLTVEWGSAVGHLLKPWFRGNTYYSLSSTGVLTEKSYAP